MGHLGGDKKNQVLFREFALLAVSKTPLGGSAPAPRMRAAIYVQQFEGFQESDYFGSRTEINYETVFPGGLRWGFLGSPNDAIGFSNSPDPHPDLLKKGRNKHFIKK